MDIPDPPPPYSETDVSSNGHSNETTTGAGPQSSVLSGRPPLLPGSSASMSHTQPAATLPPGSENEGIYARSMSSRRTNSVSGSFFPTSSSSSAAAQDYFESRPLPTGFFQEHHITHTISLLSSSRPDDFPYSQDWAARHVSSSDWYTFLNFLLPNHATTRNEAIIDRKLLAEEKSIYPSSSDGRARAHASVHLEQLRRASAADIAVNLPNIGVRREAEAVTAEWNAYFFQPRAMWVRLAFEQFPLQRQAEHRPHMPAAWDSSFDRHHQQGDPISSLPAPNQPILFQPYWVSQPYQQQQTQTQPSRSGFNFAGIKLNDDGFSIGNTFVVDRNGVRVGGLVADTNGVSYRDNVIAGPGMFSGGSSHGYPGSVYHGTHPHVYHGPQVDAYRPTSSPGFPPGQRPLPGSFPADDQKPYTHHVPFTRTHSEAQSIQKHLRRGSESPSGSESSISYESSLSSLPEYDDLSTSQLPIFQRILHAWLIQPEDHITKQHIQRLKAELVEAKRTESEYPPQSIDSKAMRAEIKSLSQAFRALKRAQRGVRRERRREKRARKKAERKERRGQRRENSFGLGIGGSPLSLPGIPPPRTSSSGMLPPGPSPIIGPPGGFPHGPWNSGPISAPPFAPPFGYASGFGLGHGGVSPGASYSGAPQTRALPAGTDQRQREAGELLHAPNNPHKRSQAKFSQLDELEKKLARWCTQLDEARDGQLKGKQDRENEAASMTTTAREETESANAGKQVENNPETVRLAEEVDLLTQDVKRLRVEADEAFARELEEQERRQAGASR